MAALRSLMAAACELSLPLPFEDDGGAIYKSGKGTAVLRVFLCGLFAAIIAALIWMFRAQYLKQRALSEDT